jgi:hypothetical protein
VPIKPSAASSGLKDGGIHREGVVITFVGGVVAATVVMLCVLVATSLTSDQ